LTINFAERLSRTDPAKLASVIRCRYGLLVTQEEREAIRARIEQWNRAAPVLEELRRRAIQESDTIRAIDAFAGLFRHAAASFSPKPTSGLVEQQRWFRKLSSG